MAVIPVIERWESGEDVTAHKLNARTTDPIDFLYDPPTCKLARKITTQSLGTLDYMSFDSVLLDTDNMADLSRDSTRMFINTPGWYTISVTVPYADSANGSWRAFVINRSGVEEFSDNRLKFGAGNWAMSMTGSAWCNAGDYLQLQFYHDAGTLTTRTIAQGVTLFAQWVSK